MSDTRTTVVGLTAFLTLGLGSVDPVAAQTTIGDSLPSVRVQMLADPVTLDLVFTDVPSGQPVHATFGANMAAIQALLGRSTHPEPSAGVGSPQEPAEFCCDRPHLGLTAIEIGILLVAPWYFNRHVSDDSTAVISWDSWKRNIVQGFEWDGDNFKTNMFAHPYHGNTYFNSARSNGYNFWQSAAFAWGGSFLWETFGEANRPAINDWIATAVGGIAIGETMNRVSRLVWDNSATGFGRTLRELGGFLLNPMGGGSRLFRGEWTKVGANPPDRFPSANIGDMSLGVRWVGAEGTTDAQLGGYFAFDYRYGDAFEVTQKPFDAFQLAFQVNGNDEKTRLGRLQIEGSLVGTELKESPKAKHVFYLAQHFDYVNNETLETGGSSLAAVFLSRWGLSDDWNLVTKIEPAALLLWGINSEFADFTRRDYDFGSGAGLRTRGVLYNEGRELIGLEYLLFWQHTLNGAAGNVVIQFLGARGTVPISKKFGLGATGFLTLRNSYYRDFPDVYRSTPQLRAYVTYFFLQ